MRQREKLFGYGRPRPLDRNAKARIMHYARCLAHERAPGRQRGIVTRAALEVLQTLLWAFHGAKNGLCFPSYEKIAEAAQCARSTVYEAIRMLEDAQILTWVNRIKRVRERCVDLLGDQSVRWRVLRTSNAYSFRDPNPGSGEISRTGVSRSNPSKSEKATGTENPGLDSSLFAALDRLKEGIRGRAEPPLRA
jgi:hypothetical protein